MINFCILYRGVGGDDDLTAELGLVARRSSLVNCFSLISILPTSHPGPPCMKARAGEPRVTSDGLKIKRQDIRRLPFLEILLIQRFYSGIRDKDNRKVSGCDLFMTQNFFCGLEDCLRF